MSSFKIPSGPAKGTPLEEAETKDIEFWGKRKSEELKKDPEHKYADHDRKWLEAARAELDRRKSGGQKAQPRGSVSREETTKAIELYAGAHDNAKEATAALVKIAEVGHLISPAPACATLPEGCSLLISAIMINEKRETYPVPGGLGLDKTALNKLGAALGVSWSPVHSRRYDNGRHPLVYAYHAVGIVRNFDGSQRFIDGSKVMDLRDGSTQVQALQQRAEAKAEKARNEGKTGKDAEVADWQSQLRDLRLFIAEHAETKAKLRAIRSLGLRTSYTKEELNKPFFVAQLQFTGRSDDPEIRKMFAGRIADNFMGQTLPALYGQQQPGAPAPPDFSPPGLDDDDAIDTEGEIVDDPHGPDGVPADDEFGGDDPDGEERY